MISRILSVFGHLQWPLIPIFYPQSTSTRSSLPYLFILSAMLSTRSMPWGKAPLNFLQS